jgi:hypothetical protein
LTAPEAQPADLGVPEIAMPPAIDDDLQPIIITDELLARLSIVDRYRRLPKSERARWWKGSPASPLLKKLPAK